MIEVPATSAFVLLFTNQDMYKGSTARTFMSKIDLSAADPIKEAFKDHWEQKRTELLNRKHGVEKGCRQFLDAHPTAQVIHLGGGLDPLSIDLAECYPQAQIYDVDMAHMPLKAEINQSLGGPEIAFLTANLADVPSLTTVLSGAGWSADSPTLLVSEGISYYIPKNVYSHTLAALRTSGGRLVFEYSIPDELLVGTPMAEVYLDFYTRFTALLELPFPMQRYDDSEVNELASNLNGEVQEILIQKELEFSRLGKNVMRKDPTMGSIRVATITFH